jgi:hypothetical protein
MRLVTVLLALLLALAAGAVQAGPPVQGNYQSLQGDMLSGRFSESWAGGGQGQIGNTVHAMSWNGTALGTEWYVACPVLGSTPTLVSDSRDITGTGFVSYRSDYVGGRFWLSGVGAWAGGDAFYAGALDYYIHVTEFLFVYGVPISYVTDVQFGGKFDGYCLCLTVIANAASGSSGAQPSGYPPYLQSDCSVNTGLTGEYGDVMDITMSIYPCASGVENSTWGGVKALFK